MSDRLSVAAASPLDRRSRDFLLLNIFVYLRHGYVTKASILAEALNRLGDDTAEVHLARAVLRYAAGAHAEALEALRELDRVDPLERFGDYRLTERQRMRRYLKLRCLHEIGETGRVRDALDSYMRHGEAGPDASE
ncbi:hypothetical protein [Antarcticirhabdus aurantiaca]|uniref:Uncharacterized protein n=1 Tax=Antarcticirhabdus aurantiaca TaxID=2606717 RepID=A0ACD4NUJ7_9HYPH|nr:hypothetical protein [Antarcticirhabdus aurantiaca]WAJ30509.1 hypothetical protein OXU80_10020 [Jeongeuplla avenae]